MTIITREILDGVRSQIAMSGEPTDIFFEHTRQGRSSADTMRFMGWKLAEVSEATFAMAIYRRTDLSYVCTRSRDGEVVEMKRCRMMSDFLRFGTDRLALKLYAQAGVDITIESTAAGSSAAAQS